MIIITVLATSFALAIMVIVLYLYILGFNGIRISRKAELPLESDDKKFLVLIPAHEEAIVIKQAIDSIKDTDYNQELVEIVVLADNCTDSTADIARGMGVQVLERHDNEKFGKGYVIEWALSKIDIDNYDAVTVIDADNIIEKNYFKVNAGLLDNGVDIIQAYFGFFNVSKTTYSYILYLANLIENLLLYNSRSNLKLHVFLRGSGMVFKPEVLHIIPWVSKSITEDVNYSIELISNDKKIHFTARTRVYEEALSYINQSFNQRLRYNTGIISLIKNNSVRLFKLGVQKKDLLLIETSLSFFLLSKPLLLSASLFLLALNLIFNISTVVSVISFFNIAAILLYFNLGLLLKPVKGPLLKTMIAAPFFGIWLVVIYVLSSFGYKKGVWVRTPRVINNNK